MTIAQHGTPTTQTGQAPGPLGAGAPPAPPQPYGWRPTPARAPGGKILPIAVGAAIVLSAAALVVGIVALMRPASTTPATPAVTTQGHTTGSPEANRAFCTDIAPLVTESDKSSRAFSSLDKKSPDFKTAAQPFITETKSLVGRMQTVIDAHGDADPFLTRSMQRFVDDQRYIIDDLVAGDGPEWLPYDQTSWNDGVSAQGSPARICWDLGVKW